MPELQAVSSTSFPFPHAPQKQVPERKSFARWLRSAPANKNSMIEPPTLLTPMTTIDDMIVLAAAQLEQTMLAPGPLVPQQNNDPYAWAALDPTREDEGQYVFDFVQTAPAAGGLVNAQI